MILDDEFYWFFFRVGDGYVVLSGVKIIVWKDYNFKGSLFDY